MAWILNIVLTLGVGIFILFIRLLSVLPKFRPRRAEPRKRGSPTQLLVVLGSGGHTAEMLLLLRDLDTASYTFRRYVVSSGDNFSVRKAAEFEKTLALRADKQRIPYGDFDIRTVARAREIHQSLLSTPLTAAKSMWDCITVLRSKPTPKNAVENHNLAYPDIIVTNGPATATIMIFASVLLRFLGWQGARVSMRCVYVESWARVTTPSLSGKILAASGACDRILSQWANLSNWGFEFRGQLIE